VVRFDHSQLDVLQQIVPEAILCCKDINERCRSAAYDLLVLIGRVMQVSTQPSFLLLIV
jgi:hypothetical protein